MQYPIRGRSRFFLPILTLIFTSFVAHADQSVLDWWSGTMAYNPYNVTSSHGFQLGGMSEFGDSDVWSSLDTESYWLTFHLEGEELRTHGDPLIVDDMFDPVVLDHSRFDVTGTWRIDYGLIGSADYSSLHGNFDLQGQWIAPSVGPAWHPEAYMTAALWVAPDKGEGAIDLSGWLLRLEAVSSMDGPIEFGDIYAAASSKATVVPEPATAVLLCTGVGAMVWRARRRGV